MLFSQLSHAKVLRTIIWRGYDLFSFLILYVFFFLFYVVWLLLRLFLFPFLLRFSAFPLLCFFFPVLSFVFMFFCFSPFLSQTEKHSSNSKINDIIKIKPA